MTNEKNKLPLVVDLDGTLINTDLLHESLLFALLKNPRSLPKILKAMPSGKAIFKIEAAKGFRFDPSTLPYNQSVIDEIRAAKLSSRPVYLASASDQSLVDAISDHLRFFDEAWGSTESKNLKSELKREFLDEKLGPGNYEYVGNSKADVPVWLNAKAAIVVSDSRSLKSQIRAAGINYREVSNPKPNNFKIWMRQLRIHQWVKNLLLFVPVFVAFGNIREDVFISLLAGFFSFGLIASSVYIVNDLVDIDNDRFHEKKRFRPLASGNLSIFSGLLMAMLLLFAGILISSFQGIQFLLTILIYLLTTTIYTFVGKKLVLIDALLLAFLYTLRIVAGGILASLPLSNWLLTMSVFLFASLAWVKRYAELEAGMKVGKKVAMGRGYKSSDLAVIQAFGISSGFIAVLVFALFLDSPEVSSKYASPEIGALALAPLTFFIAHIWLRAHRGEMNQDPILFATKDLSSIISGILITLILVIAKFGV